MLGGHVCDGAVDRLRARAHPEPGRDGPVPVQRRAGAGGQAARQARGGRHRGLHFLREHHGRQHPSPLQGPCSARAGAGCRSIRTRTRVVSVSRPHGGEHTRGRRLYSYSFSFLNAHTLTHLMERKPEYGKLEAWRNRFTEIGGTD